MSVNDPNYKEFNNYCWAYKVSSFITFILGWTVSFTIITINIILRAVLITLIKWIGQDTHSKQMKSISNGIFAANFFNTAILLMLVSANFKELGLPLDNVIKGHYSDFIPEWYTVVGYKIVQTMIINALFPLFELCYTYAYIWVSRKRDSSWSNDDYKTKQTSM